ncbi:hypothetical protein BD324DRAFT_640283 [Kockovaella imperatae]|uniref:Uncharacterized protein n=1 Tax=Kockovaella imperatae TaxID=4999 RepID=A0A1Y1U5P3_9TREE|nr:hypothetical protein BD324DRAFT_640283 [Kockovaella imperatae]ORX33312.1 hypothetical protein BD324DRAFT_640283 [Kockovaella imperatae]
MSAISHQADNYICGVCIWSLRHIVQDRNGCDNNDHHSLVHSDIYRISIYDGIAHNGYQIRYRYLRADCNCHCYCHCDRVDNFYHHIHCLNDHLLNCDCADIGVDVDDNHNHGWSLGVSVVSLPYFSYCNGDSTISPAGSAPTGTACSRRRTSPLSKFGRWLPGPWQQCSDAFIRDACQLALGEPDGVAISTVYRTASNPAITTTSTIAIQSTETITVTSNIMAT